MTRPLTPLLLLCACQTAQDTTTDAPSFERHEIRIGGAPYFVAATDLDGDGTVDLAVVGDGVVVLRGFGDGTFETVAELPAGDHPVGLAVADFDRDGNADLVVTNHETDHVTLFDGIGPMQFRPGRTFVVGVAPHVHAAATGDVDGDGNPDLLVDHRDAEAVEVFRGLGDGTFEGGRTLPMGGDPYRGLVLQDVDGDGRLDVVTPNVRDVGVRLGRGDGSFGELQLVPVETLVPFGVAVGDVDGDGRADIAAAGGEQHRGVEVFRGTADGFGSAPDLGFEAGDGAKSIVARDLDGDGRAELIVGSWRSPDLTVAWSGPDRRIERVPAGTNPFGVAAADLDGDGRGDLVTANAGDGTVAILLQR